MLDREATDAEKENIVAQRQQDAYTELLDQWTEEADFTVNEKEWKKAELNDYDQYTIKQEDTEETADDTSAEADGTSDTTEENAEETAESGDSTAE